MSELAVRQTPLLIALTCDADSDFFDSSIASDAARRELSWCGIEEGIPALIDIVNAFADSNGSPPAVTWFVRVDNQLREMCGDAGYLLDRYSSIWQACMSRGDEVAWHPHLYRNDGQRWVQETDERLLESNLVEAHEALLRRGFRPTASRIGDAFCSNGVLAALDQLGIRYDSTALPGRVRKDEERSIDWMGTPEMPYRPSCVDYRRPGEPARQLTEVPMSMVLSRAEYDRAPLYRYLDLSFRHESLRDGLRCEIGQRQLLVAITHPSTLLPHPTGGRHGLLSFDRGEFRRNLQFLIDECERIRRPFRFITLSESAACLQ